MHLYFSKRSLWLTASVLFGAVLPVSYAAAAPQYYSAAMSFKLAVENDVNPTTNAINVMSLSQKALINLVQNRVYSAKISNDVVMALRMDDCTTGAAQFVVYDKLTRTEIKPVLQPFNLFDTRANKSKFGVIKESKFYSVGQFLDSETPNYGINSGEIAFSGHAKFGADGCPTSLTGSLLGRMNITIMDNIGAGDFPKSMDTLIINGSTLTAKRL